VAIIPRGYFRVAIRGYFWILRGYSWLFLRGYLFGGFPHVAISWCTKPSNFNEILRSCKGIPLQNVRKSMEIQWILKGYPIGPHWISMGFAHFARGYPLQNVGNQRISMNSWKGYPLKISLIFGEIHTFCERYPLQNVRESMDFNEILRCTPLRSYWTLMKFIHFARGTAPLAKRQKSNGFRWNSEGYPLTISLYFNEICIFHNGYPLQNVRKLMDFDETLMGIPLRFNSTSIRFIHFARGTFCKPSGNQWISMKSWGVSP